MTPRARQNEYGFDFGAARVWHLDAREDGTVWIEIGTDREKIVIRVTPSGLIRLDSGVTKR